MIFDENHETQLDETHLGAPIRRARRSDAAMSGKEKHIFVLLPRT